MKISSIPIEFLDFTALPIIDAHYYLGKEVKKAVHQRLNTVLESLDETLISKKIETARIIKEVIENRSQENSRISKDLQLYLSCCKAWVDGSELENFRHSKLDKIENFSQLDLFFFLQWEFTGCQTGMYRQKDGSVSLWHTEEDIDEIGTRFDLLRFVSFKVDETIINTLIYPDLMPGSAFSWTDNGTAIAIDSLLLVPEISRGTFANLLYWMVLFCHNTIPAETIIAELLPSLDSGAINIVRLGDNIQGMNYEFSGSQFSQRSLGFQPGNFLFQTNASNLSEIENANSTSVSRLENQQFYTDRETRTANAIEKMDNPSLYDFFQMMASKQGGEYAYANRDVKAYFIVNLSTNGYEIWLGSGMAKLNRPPIVIRKIFDSPNRTSQK